MTSGDTIVAISSAVGEAARMIVRLSGPGSLQILRGLSGFGDPPTRAFRANLAVAGLTVPAWVYTFHSPNSYTGEDSVELHLPGNPLLARMIVNVCVSHGARLAEAGEFTARAYFNGRLDLTEAEGVAATIAAHGDAELAAARQLLAGELSRRLKPAMDRLADTLALVEVGIDFVDEDVTFLPREQLLHRVSQIDALLADLQTNSGRFEKLSHEPRVVLVGRPNAGKSTLFNALARQDRAIVSPVAGTTRDVLGATVFLRRGSIQLLDVAGLEETPVRVARPGDEHVGTQMQQQARQAIETADVVVHVRAATDDEAAGPLLPRKAHLAVHTKIDLLGLTPPAEPLGVSAVTGEGLDALRDRLDTLAFGSAAPEAALVLTARHHRALADAREALARVTMHAEAEVIAMELHEALDALGQVLGWIAPDELLGRIFAAFCIGK